MFLAPCLLSAQPIVANHAIVDDSRGIPAAYLDLVKQMWVDIPGESHSSGYRHGCTLLSQIDPRYAVSVRESGTPDGPTDEHLRISRASWGDITHTTGWRYGYGEEDWFTTPTAIQRTKDHVTYSNGLDLGLAAIGFGWCWDMTATPSTTPNGVDPVYGVHWGGRSEGGPEGSRRWGLDADDFELTGNSVSMDTYIDSVEQLVAHCVANGYPTRPFFTTGPVDGGGNRNETGYQRYLKHEHIRDHVAASSDRALMDYADLLTWSNAETQNTTTWTPSGGPTHTFPYIHSDNMLDLDGSYAEDGDHIGQRGTVRLARALWWMLARIAGWDGTPEIVLTVDDAFVNEGASGASLDFVVTLTGTPSSAVNVDYSTVSGTAGAGTDYVETAGSLSFAVGEHKKTVSVPVIPDTGDEPNEQLELHLSGATGASIVDGVAIGTIIDDDVVLAIQDASAAETDGTTMMTFEVTLSE